MISSGNKLLDVAICFIIIFLIMQGLTWLFKKFFVKDSTKPIGGNYEGVDNNSPK